MTLPANRDGLPEYSPFTSPHISPEIAIQAALAQQREEIAIREGYDPEDVNAGVKKRASALLIDGAIYTAVMGALSLILGIFGMAEYGFLLLSVVMMMGPAGFYAYRAAGDAIFEGSPGKHMMGLDTKGPNGLPVSAKDGLTRNLWILPSLIPVAGWFVSAGMLAWMTYTAQKDPLGRGGHERGAQTRVVEKRPRKELPRR